MMQKHLNITLTGNCIDTYLSAICLKQFKSESKITIFSLAPQNIDNSKQWLTVSEKMLFFIETIGLSPANLLKYCRHTKEKNTLKAILRQDLLLYLKAAANHLSIITATSQAKPSPLKLTIEEHSKIDFLITLSPAYSYLTKSQRIKIDQYFSKSTTLQDQADKQPNDNYYAYNKAWSNNYLHIGAALCKTPEHLLTHTEITINILIFIVNNWPLSGKIESISDLIDKKACTCVHEIIDIDNIISKDRDKSNSINLSENNKNRVDLFQSTGKQLKYENTIFPESNWNHLMRELTFIKAGHALREKK